MELLSGILIFFAFFVPVASLIAVACMSEGWSPVYSWEKLQEARRTNKKRKLILDIEIREAELALQEREQALLERKLGM